MLKATLDALASPAAMNASTFWTQPVNMPANLPKDPWAVGASTPSRSSMAWAALGSGSIRFASLGALGLALGAPIFLATTSGLDASSFAAHGAIALASPFVGKMLGAAINEAIKLEPSPQQAATAIQAGWRAGKLLALDTAEMVFLALPDKAQRFTSLALTRAFSLNSARDSLPKLDRDIHSLHEWIIDRQKETLNASALAAQTRAPSLTETAAWIHARQLAASKPPFLQRAAVEAARAWTQRPFNPHWTMEDGSTFAQWIDRAAKNEREPESRPYLEQVSRLVHCAVERLEINQVASPAPEPSAPRRARL